MSQLALFDTTPVSDIIHVLMPNMAYACGGNIVSKGGHFQVGINKWAAIDCDGCREPGEAEIRAEMRRQQGLAA